MTTAPGGLFDGRGGAPGSPASISARASSRGCVEDGGCAFTDSVRGGIGGRAADRVEEEAGVTPEFVVLLITGDLSDPLAAVSFFGVIPEGLGLSETRAVTGGGSRFLFLTL